jgi:peptidoglycan LD-endopeptidase CwlK
MKKRKLGIFCILCSIFIICFWFFSKNTQSYENIALPDELYPIVAEKRDTLIRKAKEKGISIYVYDDIRTMEEQNKLYEQGRSKSGSIVTYAKGGESYHNYGLAFDFAIQLEDGNVIWDLEYDGNGNGQSDWLEVAEIAKDLGFEWGGDWDGFKDYPHLQMDFGLTIDELKRGIRP